MTTKTHQQLKNSLITADNNNNNNNISICLAYIVNRSDESEALAVARWIKMKY